MNASARLVATALLLPFLATLPVQAQLPGLGLAGSYESLPNGGLEGPVDADGVGTYFALKYDGAVVETADALQGVQAVNLARGGARPTDFSSLGQVVLRPDRGTPFGTFSQFSYWVRVPVPLTHGADLQTYLSLDAGNDGARDFCLATDATPASDAPQWRQAWLNRTTLVHEMGSECSVSTGAVPTPLATFQASPLHANAAVLGVHVQLLTSARSAWPEGQPVIVDGASLAVDAPVQAGPLGYHAQFDFQPPLVQDGDRELVAFQDGHVTVEAALFDAQGRPQDFRNGLDADGVARPARLVATGRNETGDGAQDWVLTVLGTVNATDRHRAEFRLAAADLLPLVQEATAWELRVESSYETYPAGGPAFPSAFAYYNRDANDAFGAQPAAADAQDAEPTTLWAVKRADAVAVAAHPPGLVMRNQPFAMAIEVVDQAGRRWPAASMNLTASIAAGVGALLGNLTVPVEAGVATFADLALDAIGLQTIRVQQADGALNRTVGPIQVVGPVARPGVVLEGSRFDLEYVLGSDVDAARVRFIDMDTGRVVATVELRREMRADGVVVWVGSVALAQAGHYRTELVQDTAHGQSWLPGDTVEVEPKKRTPAPLGSAALGVLGLAAWSEARRRRA